MIKLATPISHLFKDENNAAMITGASDCLECREWCIDTTVPKQELIHYDVNINLHWDEHEKEQLLKAFESKPELKLVTFQMASCYTHPVLVDRMFQPGGNKLSAEEMRKNVAINARWLKQVVRPGVLVGIENNNYYPTPAYEYVTDPAFISECIRSNDLKLLLDIAHAKVSAHNMGITEEEYVSGLPLERLIQIHICGPQVREDGICIDAHELPDESIKRSVLEVGSRYPARYLTIEYYKDALKLVGSLQEFSVIRDQMQKAQEQNAVH